MFTMTFREALKIQHAQIIHYRQSIGRKGIKAIRKRTKFPEDIEPDKPMPIIEINRLVPRGISFEGLISHRPLAYDPLTFAWYDAIKRGLNV